LPLKNNCAFLNLANKSSPFGDNLKWLRDTKIFPDASVDLVELDPPAWLKPLRRGEGPPFNSNADWRLDSTSHPGPLASSARRCDFA
jgi:hypothetical protein